jgi:hypothetical protein
MTELAGRLMGDLVSFACSFSQKLEPASRAEGAVDGLDQSPVQSSVRIKVQPRPASIVPVNEPWGDSLLTPCSALHPPSLQ